MTINYFLLKSTTMRISIPIPVIQKIVSDVSEIPLSTMLAPPSVLFSRKQEVVMPRQVSMALSKKYTIHSLATIGEMHGGRDHATVLHSVKTVKNGLDTNYPTFVDIYTESDKKVHAWMSGARKSYQKRQLTGDQIPVKLKLQILRSMILNEVELEQREKIFRTVYTENDKRFKHDRHSVTTLPG